MADTKGHEGALKPSLPAEPARCQCGGEIHRTRCNDGSEKIALLCAACGAHAGFAPAKKEKKEKRAHFVPTNF